jgi:hypothetical protein
MSDHISTTTAVTSRRVLPLLLAAGAIGLVLAATLALWAHYGTAVFFETARTGFVACFG